jgi:hypothetical protein
MTTFTPQQDTTGPFTAPVPMVLDTLARHRTNTPTHDGPPAWLQLVSTIAAVAAGWFAILEWRDPAAPLLMGVALLIAGAALAVDVTAAVQARRDTAGGE